MNALPSTEFVDHQLRRLERKSLTLSRAASAVLVLLSGLGLAALLMPDLIPGAESQIAVQRASFSLAALCSLGLLLGLLTFRQERIWSAARRNLFGNLIRRDALEKLLLIDPLTGTFNGRYLDQIVAREVGRVERHGSSLTFLKIKVGNLSEARSAANCQTKEDALKTVAELLRRNFRPTDVVVRFDYDHFMVVMSETSKYGALMAVRRLLECVDALNLASQSQPGYPLKLGYGLADYRKGIDMRDVLAAADHSVRLYQGESTPMRP